MVHALLLAAAMTSGCKKAPPPAVGVDAAGFQAITERIDREVAAWVPLLQFDRAEDHVYVVIPVF